MKNLLTTEHNDTTWAILVSITCVTIISVLKWFLIPLGILLLFCVIYIINKDYKIFKGEYLNNIFSPTVLWIKIITTFISIILYCIGFYPVIDISCLGFMSERFYIELLFEELDWFGNEELSKIILQESSWLLINQKLDFWLCFIINCSIKLAVIYLLIGLNNVPIKDSFIIMLSIILYLINSLLFCSLFINKGAINGVFVHNVLPDHSINTVTTHTGNAIITHQASNQPIVDEIIGNRRRPVTYDLPGAPAAPVAPAAPAAPAVPNPQPVITNNGNNNGGNVNMFNNFLNMFNPNAPAQITPSLAPTSSSGGSFASTSAPTIDAPVFNQALSVRPHYVFYNNINYEEQWCHRDANSVQHYPIFDTKVPAILDEQSCAILNSAYISACKQVVDEPKCLRRPGLEIMSRARDFNNIDGKMHTNFSYREIGIIKFFLIGLEIPGCNGVCSREPFDTINPRNSVEFTGRMIRDGEFTRNLRMRHASYGNSLDTENFMNFHIRHHFHENRWT